MTETRIPAAIQRALAERGHRLRARPFAYDSLQGRIQLIAARDGDWIVIVRNPGHSERITARLVDGRLHIAELRVPSASETPDELVLTIDPFLPDPATTGGHDPTARFAIAVAAHADLVTGRVEPGVAGFTLIPADPAWASTRALAVTLWAAGDARRVTSTIVPR